MGAVVVFLLLHITYTSPQTYPFGQKCEDCLHFSLIHQRSLHFREMGTCYLVEGGALMVRGTSSASREEGNDVTISRAGDAKGAMFHWVMAKRRV